MKQLQLKTLWSIRIHIFYKRFASRWVCRTITVFLGNTYADGRQYYRNNEPPVKLSGNNYITNINKIKLQLLHHESTYNTRQNNDESWGHLLETVIKNHVRYTRPHLDNQDIAVRTHRTSLWLYIRVLNFFPSFVCTISII